METVPTSRLIQWIAAEAQETPVKVSYAIQRDYLQKIANHPQRTGTFCLPGDQKKVISSDEKHSNVGVCIYHIPKMRIYRQASEKLR